MKTHAFLWGAIASLVIYTSLHVAKIRILEEKITALEASHKYIGVPK